MKNAGDCPYVDGNPGAKPAAPADTTACQAGTAGTPGPSLRAVVHNTGRALLPSTVTTTAVKILSAIGRVSNTGRAVTSSLSSLVRVFLNYVLTGTRNGLNFVNVWGLTMTQQDEPINNIVTTVIGPTLTAHSDIRNKGRAYPHISNSGPVYTLIGLATSDITARSSTTPGSGTVELYAQIGGTLTDLSIAITAWNLGTIITNGSWVELVRDSDGSYFAIPQGSPALSAAPAGLFIGQVYYDTTLQSLETWNGSSWMPASTGVTKSGIQFGNVIGAGSLTLVSGLSASAGALVFSTTHVAGGAFAGNFLQITATNVIGETGTNVDTASEGAGTWNVDFATGLIYFGTLIVGLAGGIPGPYSSITIKIFNGNITETYSVTYAYNAVD